MVCDGDADAEIRTVALPSLPVLPEQVSKMVFQKYLAEVNEQLQQALSDSRTQIDAGDLHRYTAEFANALRVLSKPASESQRTQICEAMASVWDMRSNCAP